jgi:uncharacterized FlaG/YvyC family protein
MMHGAAMRNNGTGNGRRPIGARYVFQIDSDPDRAVIRVVDSLTDTVMREIPIAEFLEFARTHKNVKPLLFGRLR